MMVKLEEFRRAAEHNGFSFFYERGLKPGEVVYIRVPPISANKRGINDIGWVSDSDLVKLYATISDDVFSQQTIWQPIEPYHEVNKTCFAFKAENIGTEAARINMRIILN